MSQAAKTLPIKNIEAVYLIGVGGTGSILAEHLCRMIAGYRLRCKLTLYDGDRIEKANITRQQFFPHEIGANKAEALAIRLAGQFGLAITANGHHITPDKQHFFNFDTPPLVISCTDTLASRRVIAEAEPELWLDVGNELHHGQAVFGTTHKPSKLRADFWKFNRRKAFVADLPDMAAMNPGLLTARKTTVKAGCADQPFARQGFGVNAMAALAAATLAKQILVDRIVQHAAIYFNVSEARMLARPITQDLYRLWKNKK